MTLPIKRQAWLCNQQQRRQAPQEGPAAHYFQILAVASIERILINTLKFQIPPNYSHI